LSSIYEDIKALNKKMFNKFAFLNDVLYNKDIVTTRDNLSYYLTSAATKVNNITQLTRNNDISEDINDYPAGNRFITNDYKFNCKFCNDTKYSSSYTPPAFAHNSSYIVMATNSGLSYSSDGIDWFDINNSYLSISDINSTFPLNGITCTDKIWVISIYNQGIWYRESSNPNGTYTQSNVTSGNYCYMEYADGTFIACPISSVNGTSVSSSDAWYYSTDGKTWTQSNITATAAKNKPKYLNNKWIVMNNSNSLYCSEDKGVTWTSKYEPPSSYYTYYDITYNSSNKNYYMTKGGSDNILHSTDLSNWYYIDSSTYGYSIDTYNEVSTSANTSSMYYITSNNSCTKCTINNGSPKISTIVRPLCFDGLWITTGYYVADENNVTVNKYCILYSLNGKTWTIDNKTLDLDIYAIDRFNDVIVMANNSSTNTRLIYSEIDNNLSRGERPYGIGSAYYIEYGKLSEETLTTLSARSDLTKLTALTAADDGVCKGLTLHNSNSDISQDNEVDFCYTRPNDTTVIDISDIMEDYIGCSIIPNDLYYILYDVDNYLLYVSEDLINWRTYDFSETTNWSEEIFIDDKGRIYLVDDIPDIEDDIHYPAVRIINPISEEDRCIRILSLSQFSTDNGFSDYIQHTLQIFYNDKITYLFVKEKDSGRSVVIEIGDNDYTSDGTVEVPRMVEGSVKLTSETTTISGLDFTPDKAFITLRNGNNDSKLDSGTIIASKKEDLITKREDYSNVGKTWSNSSGVTQGYYRSICYDNGVWIACGCNSSTSSSNSGSGLYYSSDGVTWNKSNVTSGYFYNACYGNGVWIVGGYTDLWRSTDNGVTWTQCNVTTENFVCVCYGNGTWVAGGSNDGLVGYSTSTYYSTDNGVTWSTCSNISSKVTVIKYDNNIWIAGSSYNSIGLWYSTDGKTWTQSSKTSGYFESIYYANNLWVASGNTNDAVVYSEDNGKTWSSSNISKQTRGVYNANGIWVLCGYGSGMYYSTDGKTWTQSNSFTSYNFYFVMYGGNIWVAVGQYGLFYSTDNGVTWLQSNISYTFNNIYYGNGVWVACTYTNKVILVYSTFTTSYSDASSQASLVNINNYNKTHIGNWQTTSSPASFSYLCYGYNGILIGSAGSSGLYYSEDTGLTWTKCTVGGTTSYTYNFSQIAYLYSSGPKYVVGTYSYGLFYSTNGKTWYQDTSVDTSASINYVTASPYHILFETGRSKGIWKFDTDTLSSTKLTTITLEQAERLCYCNSTWFVPNDQGIYYCKMSGSTFGTWTAISGVSNTIYAELVDINYGNGVYIADHEYYHETTYLRSTDGTSWTQYTTSFSTNQFVYGNIWVIGTYGSGLYYSTDCITLYPSNVTTGNFYNIVYVNKTWVAYDYDTDKATYYSSDGKTWVKDNNGDYCIPIIDVNYSSSATKIFGRSLNGASNNVSYIEAPILFATETNDIKNKLSETTSSDISTLYSSTNTLGRSWVQSNITTQIHCVTYANGIWVAGSRVSKGIFYSTDGINWSSTNITSNDVVTISYGNGVWVADVGNIGVYYSYDGITWNVTSITSGTYTAVTYYNGLWLIGSGSSSEKNGIYYSYDGINWTKCTGIDSTYFYYDTIKHANGMWVAAPRYSGIYYSYDGINWTKCNGGGNLYDLKYAQGKWVGSSSSMYYSYNGVDWYLGSITTDSYASICYGNNGVWAAANDDDSGLYYSFNGINWYQSSITSGFWTKIHYVNGVFLANKYNGGIYYSTNGINWYKSDLTTGAGFNGFAYNDGMIVLGGYNGIYYSKLDDDVNTAYGNVNNNAFIDGSEVQINVDSDYIGAYADYTLIGRKVTERSTTKATKISKFI
jgi:photosystem II stability/assembly factor-like uncharacterized protein